MKTKYHKTVTDEHITLSTLYKGFKLSKTYKKNMGIKESEKHFKKLVKEAIEKYEHERTIRSI